MKHFGSELRKWRQKKEISLTKFAKRLGKSPTYISKIENGKENPPPVELIVKMADMLDWDAEEAIRVASKDHPKRIPGDVTKSYGKNDTFRKKVPEFLRTAAGKNLSSEEWDKLIEQVHKIQRKEDESKIPDG